VLSRAIGCSVQGLAGVPVVVEADIANGLPNFTIVGLTDRAIQEARERVRASIRNAGFAFPTRRLTVNLAPAEVRKEGTGFDLTDAMPIVRPQAGERRVAGAEVVDGEVEAQRLEVLEGRQGAN
jgi:magnesium chelatase family protein